MRGIFTLTPVESKKLIAKGIVAMEEVKTAMEKGKVIIAGGTTNGYIVRELLKKDIDPYNYTVGIVTEGKLCMADFDKVTKPISIVNGEISTKPWLEVLKEFNGSDVFIKGANAIDMEGKAGILLGVRNGGTIGQSLGILSAVGAQLIIPAGLSKLIPSVEEASKVTGIDTYYRKDGMAVGMMVVSGDIITELEAIEILTGAYGTCIASGGVLGSEGAVTIVVEGTKEEVDATMDIVKEIKEDYSADGYKRYCPCNDPCEMY
jgi:hypothetical protein